MTSAKRFSARVATGGIGVAVVTTLSSLQLGPGRKPSLVTHSFITGYRVAAGLASPGAPAALSTSFAAAGLSFDFMTSSSLQLGPGRKPSLVTHSFITGYGVAAASSLQLGPGRK